DVDDAAFGDLQIHGGASRNEIDTTRQPFDHVLGAELPSRHVDRYPDRDAERALPLAYLSVAGRQYPLADVHDQAVDLAQRDELVGPHGAEHGILPAQQCLEPRDPHRFQVEDRLVLDPELALLQSTAKLRFQ